jgi:hypothetical protein
VKASDLFAAVGLSPSGISWGTPCPDTGPGVYVIAIDGAVVYVGRARRSLRRRLNEFYRHRYGDKRPHRGGQELLNMAGIRQVFWATTPDAANAEERMIRCFEQHQGRLPPANKRRGDAIRT